MGRAFFNIYPQFKRMPAKRIDPEPEKFKKTDAIGNSKQKFRWKNSCSMLTLCNVHLLIELSPWPVNVNVNVKHDNSRRITEQLDLNKLLGNFSFRHKFFEAHHRCIKKFTHRFLLRLIFNWSLFRLLLPCFTFTFTFTGHRLNSKLL